jgi:general secretion pathway protein E
MELREVSGQMTGRNEYREVRIEDELDTSLNLRLSVSYMEEHKFLPLRYQGERLIVAFANPRDLETIDDLRSCLKCEIDAVTAPQEEILEGIKKLYGEGVETIEKMVKDMSEGELVLGNGRGDEVADLRDLASQAPVIKLVNLIIMEALNKRASDIHIEAMEDQLRVRYRVDGVLHDISAPPKRFQAAIVSRIKIMAEMNIAERRLSQDGRIGVRLKDKDIDLRVSTVPTLYGESVVIRILDKSTILLDLEDLGFSKEVYNAFHRMIQMPHGIILVTGPTGSGKTTTLYSALNEINSPEKKIITLEDPVEYHLKGINQIPVKPKIGLTFATGLRSIVRQDPDVIMIGEMRDYETAEIAIQSALTGHLVFSTLHTNDAPGGITRLIDMGVEPYLVSSAVEGILAQRLVRVICPDCREEAPPDRSVLKDLGISEGAPAGKNISRGKGCAQCDFTGYRGRLGIFEFLTMSDVVKEMVLEKKSTNIIKEKARSEGMTVLREDGMKKVLAGITTVEEVMRVTQDEALS